MSTLASDSLEEPGSPSIDAPLLASPPDDYRGLWEMYADSLRGPRGRAVVARRRLVDRRCRHGQALVVDGDEPEVHPAVRRT